MYTIVEIEVQKMKEVKNSSNLAGTPTTTAPKMTKSTRKHEDIKEASVDATGSDEIPSKPAKSFRAELKQPSPRMMVIRLSTMPSRKMRL